MSLPRIAITSGDPAGVGPELCLKLAATESIRRTCIPILFGDASVFRRVAAELQLAIPGIHEVSKMTGAECEQLVSQASQPAILDFGLLAEADVHPGKVTAQTGNASFQYIESAIQLALSRSVDAIVTGPIHKEALNAAGVPFPGHTEILADRTKAERHLMMLTSEQITCSVVTAHVGLNQVSRLLTCDAIVDAIELSHVAMQRMRDRKDVRLIVCGLNPHAGEGGLFGEGEEESIIAPAVRVAKEKGIDVIGPLPPDTAFLPKYRETTDCYVCMYHDQGLIPLKALAFDEAVNVTLGLPIVRTSVDHGTALDIAWEGKASESSFIKAVELAVKLAGSNE